MQNLVIREATIDDKEELLEFEQKVIEYERPFNQAIKNGRVFYYDLNELIYAPTSKLIVGMLDEEIIACGYARIEKSESFIEYPEYAYLGFMYVKPGYRGRGINYKIIENLKDWAKSKNIRELRLDVYEQNSSAIKAYEKFGFKKSIVNMRMNL
jgi:GNAT superfamily N-acetyltransferase